MSDDYLYDVWLSVTLGAGSASVKTLLEHYKSAENVYRASEDDLRELGLRDGEVARLDAKDLDEAKRCLAYCEKEHIGLIRYGEPYYPDRLRAITDPPALLYYRGRFEKLDELPVFAMVGTRSCSEAGFRHAYKIAYNAAYGGGAVISGLALGIDTACVTGCLDAGGYAIGVLGCGIDRIYPPQNKELFVRLSHNGLILSEFPPFSPPIGNHFPVRNRVISAIACATAIFEASVGSGAMITASHALRQGKKIFAVPGSAENKLYEGPVSLIKNGAAVLTDEYDLIREFAAMFPEQFTRTPPSLPVRKLNAAVREAFSVNRDMKQDEKPSRTLKKPFTTRMSEASRKKAGSKPSDRVSEKPVSAKEPAPAPSPSSAQPDRSLLSPCENAVFDLIDAHGVLSLDEITSGGIRADDALSALTLLEVYGLIRSLPGGRYERS